jgi:hypothetical protein
MTTLDRHCEEKGRLRVDCLKVDVEGAEAGVLDAGAELLNDPGRRLRLILLELYGPVLAKFHSGIGDIRGKMRSFGYSPFICTEGQLIPFERRHYNHFYSSSR